MNKPYLVSLGRYLTINAILYILISIAMSNPITISGFLLTTSAAFVIYRFLLFGRVL